MEYIQEKEIFRYVLATADGTYLKSLHMGSYCFSDIESCTKFASQKLANNIFNITGMIRKTMILIYSLFH